MAPVDTVHTLCLDLGYAGYSSEILFSKMLNWLKRRTSTSKGHKITNALSKEALQLARDFCEEDNHAQELWPSRYRDNTLDWPQCSSKLAFEPLYTHNVADRTIIRIISLVARLFFCLQFQNQQNKKNDDGVEAKEVLYRPYLLNLRLIVSKDDRPNVEISDSDVSSDDETADGTYREKDGSWTTGHRESRTHSTTGRESISQTIFPRQASLS